MVVKMRRFSSLATAKGAFSETAFAEKPSGRRVTRSPWLIQTGYPDLARVPTWSYLAVHCQVTARLLDHEDAAGKDALLKALIGDHEPAYAAQWRAMDQELAHKLLNAIVAFELTVTDWQCKLKMNQHRPESHAALHAMYAAGTPDERALAAWMQDLGMVPATPAEVGSVVDL